ncbi:MAG: hypothetical protein HYX92_03140 [Chloroflexi bacterium]|nr:hypothetical protein [Chloroflexota bacterium]
MGEPVYEVVWPLGRLVYETLPLAHRCPDLAGKTVCELWDWLFRGGEIFPAIREVLSSRYPDIKFVEHTVFGDTRGAREREVVAALPDLLHKHGCDAVISGIGA